MLPEEPRISKQARGTRLVTGDLARRRRRVINILATAFEDYGYDEIVLPSIELAEIYTDKAGDEVLGQMYTFADRKGRQLCLRPEGTATCQILAREFPRERDTKIWYEARCWRYERPQAGRYREFSQIGVEVLNPVKSKYEDLVALSYDILKDLVPDLVVCNNVARGLAYYTQAGFEISCPRLGSQSQILGGGRYQEGFGFALGLDRLLIAMEMA